MYKNKSINMNCIEQACRIDGYDLIAGIDEAGRGALAGPVIAAAVILPENYSLVGLTDSKKVSPKQRSYLRQQIYKDAIAICVGTSDISTITRLNIRQATLLAMQEAIHNLSPQPDYLLVDGLDLPRTSIARKAVPKGDT